MFPFDQPTPTAFYLVCYLGTLVLHVLPMNYVLAGSTYLAGLHLWEAVRGREVEPHAAIGATLRDWMPFALSVTITAGVAPLLFLQILYKEPFYTANLLLFHRWMAILPVLIAAFYLLYVQKMKRLASGSGWLRVLVSMGVIACFGFVAWSWTENHLLSTRGQEVWVEQYASGALFYGDWELPPRLALWYFGAFPAMAVIVAWQLRGEADPSIKPLAGLALGGLVLAAMAAIAYAVVLPADTRSEIAGTAWPYLGVAVAAVAAKGAIWGRAWGRGKLGGKSLGMLTAAACCATIGMTVVREVRRVQAIDIQAFHPAHEAASGVGGLAAFLLFFLLNTGLIAGVVILVRRGLRAQQA